MIQLIFKYEWKHFYRNWLQVAFYVFLFVIGIYSIGYGYREIAKQRDNIALIEENEREQFNKITEAFKADTATKDGKTDYMRSMLPGLGRWMHRYNAIFYPASLTAFSLGQRDLFPYYHKLNSHSLYMQVFKNEIVNPQKLLAGNLDLAFVIIYLIPLFIIALSYGLVSGEKENGTYPFLKTGKVSVRRLFAYRMGFRFLLSVLPVVLLSLIAAIINKSPIDGLFLSWLVVAVLYVAVWCAIALLIASFNKPSPVNAVILLGAWLFFLIMLPAFLNAVSVNKYPINQTLISDAIRRVQLDETEHGQEELFEKYYKLYPEYREYHIQSPYNLPKLYAMGGALKDKENKPVIESYYELIRSRDKYVNVFNIISPALQTQQLFNYISGSDIQYYLDYNRQLALFHKELYHFYADPLYKNKTLSAKDYDNRPRFLMKTEIGWITIYTGMLTLAGWGLILWGLAHWKMKKM
ncbi:MAG: DUF3526 domain-containing protein [Chitinophagaceae bacterium]|nr:DUF3526 domain-containing protein [Chitinophagaceae bacterium]